MTDYLRKQLEKKHKASQGIVEATRAQGGVSSYALARSDTLEEIYELLDQVRCDRCVNFIPVTGFDGGRCPITCPDYLIAPDFYCAAFQPKESE